MVKIWKLVEGSWQLDTFPGLQKHTDWVRDVAWAPNLGLLKSTIAKRIPGSASPWQKGALHPLCLIAVAFAVQV